MSVCYYRGDAHRQAHEFCSGVIAQEIQIIGWVAVYTNSSQIQENISQICTSISIDNSLQRMPLNCGIYSGKLP